MKNNEIARLALIVIAAVVFILLINSYNSNNASNVVNNNNQQMNVDNLPLLFESIDLKDAPDKLTKKWKKKFSISDKQETLTFDELLHIVDVLKNDAKNSRQAEEDVEVDDETIELFKKFDTENKGFIRLKDLRRLCKDLKETSFDDNALRELIAYAGDNGKVDVQQFAKVLKEIKRFK